ncbi:MAG: hypothetical protein R3B96_07095 [Pirellulaceae bacterium]
MNSRPPHVTAQEERLGEFADVILGSRRSRQPIGIDLSDAVARKGTVRDVGLWPDGLYLSR